MEKISPLTQAFLGPARILFVEDDKELAAYVRTALEEEGLNVTLAFDGPTGLVLAEKHPFDVILLDIMLPGLDGIEVTKRLRSEKVGTPILLLTARDTPNDIVRGLDAGADDHLAKPFDIEVLFARLRARIRAAKNPNTEQMRFADLYLDSAKREAIRGGRKLDLTRTEFSILECLMRSAGDAVPRSYISETVWGDRKVRDNNLDVYMRFLRSKVDVDGSTRLLHTERGIGYSLKETLS